MLMILVYPIGTPFMYFVLLYRKRAMLDPGQERFTHELGSVRSGGGGGGEREKMREKRAWQGWSYKLPLVS